MKDKKNGHPERAATNTQLHVTKLPPRLERLASALLIGPVTREQADRIAPASNSPQYISMLRSRLGLSLPCERVPFTTKDGEESWYGRYHATESDQDSIRFVLCRDKHKEAI